ncbi:[LSU ribosomal protein L11P]-lysine N-methyltransferase [Malonomonas rubra DSM 5091]|uniref:[LSU ribosomal protein L11P]-lysine N-methyltransferase n=1 Tax=Malonomonas rubra DSM 5091 TaxID=1122189 RepID=A0A1M6BWI5_MALRU|nr:50S ribosomal protein L11 methyltransferase [Malonomonas rubra]SHI53146.1 [LSU ribosomal protein L11P]-lysine N-methyltransferase [Malonomonas rubra DSM 5091]
MKEDYQPFVLGTRFCILPPDITPPEGDFIHLTMERGAFGSGEHETTRSCLEFLEQMNLQGNEKVLDLGSGTGILSIAALLLGAQHAWCVDIEAYAVRSCERNCERNGVNKRVTHVCGTLDKLGEDGFDLILANIYGDILLDVADNLISKAKPGTKILLSGILWEYNFDVRQKYQRLGCKLIKNKMMEEFSTVLLIKK